MSFFGNHINLTSASQSDWNKNNSKDAAHIKNRPFFIDDNGEVHKLNKKFLPNEVAMKEDIKVTSINGMTGDVIIPIGSGGTGVVVQPDWNQNDKSAPDYIKNRTHYIEDPREVTVASGIAGGYPQHEFSTPIELEGGKLYTVTVNDVEYELTAQYENNMDITYLGNPSYLGGPDNGSNTPFLIAFNTFYAPYGLYNISISALIDDVETTLINETIEFYWDWYSDGTLEAGHEYKVILDGIEYNFTATENADGSAIIIGDMTQDSFDIQYTDDSLILYSLIPGIHTISMMDMTSESEIIKYQNISGPLAWYESFPLYEIKDGQTYSVQFGDNAYSCVGVAVKYDEFSFIYLGNPVYGYVWDDLFEPDVQSTGEPFIYTYSAEYGEGCIVSDSGSIDNFSITTMESEIHTLDPKFLPEGMGYIETVNSIILSEDSFDGFAVMQEPLYAISIPFEFEPIIDGEYTVRWDGVDYTVPGVSVSGVFCLGNTNYADMLPGGDIPFAIISPYEFGEVYFVTESTAEAHTVAISGPIKKAHKMDKKLLPSEVISIGVGYNSVVLNGVPKESASGDYSHAEGDDTLASGNYSHAEGDDTTASGECSHAEGWSTTASGLDSHAEGGDTTAYGSYSHAEGQYTKAYGQQSHAEGYHTRASGQGSHAEGYQTTASSFFAHAEGESTTASGKCSHAEGFNTTASGDYSHVQGNSNIIDSNGRYAHIVGNGRDDVNRSNAHTLDWEGNAWFAGKVFVGGTSQDDAIELGTGSGQADWAQNDEEGQGYIKNRTHYIKYEGPASYTSQVGEFTSSYFDGYLLLKEGASYTVTVNGSEYNLIGQDFNGWEFLGDSYYLNGTHNSSNAPFAIMYAHGGPKLFAPYGVYDISLVEDASGNAINERVYICWDYYSSGHKLTAGNTYEVIFDDSVYEFIAAENAEGSIIIGDVTQYPFEIETVGSYNSLTLHSLETGVHTFSLIDITNNELIIDNKYVGNIQSSYIPASPLKENQEYIVRLDDNTYYCKAKREPYSNTIYIGNLANFIHYLSNKDIDISNFDFQDTEELFFITDGSVEDALVLYSGNSISELSIETIESDIQTLDPKFLPVSATHTKVGQPICDEIIFVEPGSGGNYLDISEPLEIGQFYEIQVDDKVYHAKCQEFEGAPVLGNILITYMTAIGSGAPPAELEMLMGLFEALFSLIYGTAFDLYKEIPFGIIYERNRAGFISSYPGRHWIKISPVLEISSISKTLLPKTSLPKRTVYETIDILTDAESNTVQANDGTTLYATKLSNSIFCRTIPQAIREGGNSLRLLSGIHIQQMSFDTVIIDVPLTAALVGTENDRIAIIDIYKGLRNAEDAPLSKYEQAFICVEEESSISDIDFTFTPGLWLIELEGADVDLAYQLGNKLVFATSNDIADIGIIPERIARIEDISIQYDTLKPCGEEKVYVEWSKEKVYPESNTTEKVLLSNEIFHPKQLYGKHYLIKRETENGIAVIDKIITPLDIANNVMAYDIDEIQFFNPDFLSMGGAGGLLIALIAGGETGITFPKEPKDESLIYFKIYEPMKQLDESLIPDTIAKTWNDIAEKSIEAGKVYYEWDENTEYDDFESIEASADSPVERYLKIDDNAPNPSYFIGKIATVELLNSGIIKTIIEEKHLPGNEDGYLLADFGYVVTGEPFDIGATQPLTKGIWIIDNIKDTSPFRPIWWKISESITQLNDLVIPDTIARVSELQGKTITNPETAVVGQLMVVEEIDENGAPTKWKAVDASSLMEAILPAVSAEDEGKTLTVVDGKWQLA